MSQDPDYLLGTPVRTWNQGQAKTITFIVTEDCNLVCKYCYITGKNKRNKMNFETAKKAVDYILSHPDDFQEKSVIWEFIGGEPMLEMELIDQICDYIKTEMFRLDHKWFNNYRFSFSSNGLLYHTPATQRFIEKNHNNLSIGLSVDGNKTKHDLQRIKPNGSGSYDEIVKNVPLWLEQFPNGATKATFATGDLIHLKDSIISLWELGIKTVNSNVVFEADWQEGDDLIFENQLKDLADYIIDNRLWNDYNCSFFVDNLGHPLTAESKKQNWCGAGKMLAIDYRGKFFPCVRFVGYSLNKRDEYVIGDVENGYDHAKLRPFYALNLVSQSADECIDCQVAEGCSWCQGFNYDEAKIDTIYQRATYICKMHKARVRANDYYWNRLRQEQNVQRHVNIPRKDHLYIMLADQAVRHCSYSPDPGRNAQMSLDLLQKGLEFARMNFYTSVLLLPKEQGLTPEQQEVIKGHQVILMQDPAIPTMGNEEQIRVYDNSLAPVEEQGESSVLLLRPENLAQLSEMVKALFEKQSRINLVLEDLNDLTDDDLQVYRQELEKLVDHLVELEKAGMIRELNVLSDRILIHEMTNCNAGLDSFTLAPDGQIYLCPAFYHDSEGEPVGSIDKGIDFNYQEFLTVEKSPTCSICDAYQCKRCVYANRKSTREYLISDRNQCVVSHVEREMSQKLATRLAELGLLPNLTKQSVAELFPEIDYIDPLEKVVRR